MATLLPCGEVPRELAPANGEAFTLPELQAIVGGYIEAVYLGTRPGGAVMFINEDGKGAGLPYNDAATVLARAAGKLRADDVIVGAAIVCTRLEAGG